MIFFKKTRKNICGANVKRLRESRSLTREELASKLRRDGWYRMNGRLLKRIEKQTCEVTDVQLIYLRRALDTECWQLLDQHYELFLDDKTYQPVIP